MSKFIQCLLLLLFATSVLFAESYDGEEIYSAPVQAVNTSIQPLPFFAAIAAVTGVAAVILANSTGDGIHNHGDS